MVTFKSYQNLIYYIPGTIWSLFLGSWCDRYVKAKKWIMVIGAITTAAENLINCVNSFSARTNYQVPHIQSGSAMSKFLALAISLSLYSAMQFFDDLVFQDPNSLRVFDGSFERVILARILTTE